MAGSSFLSDEIKPVPSFYFNSISIFIENFELTLSETMLTVQLPTSFT